MYEKDHAMCTRINENTEMINQNTEFRNCILIKSQPYSLDIYRNKLFGVKCCSHSYTTTTLSLSRRFADTLYYGPHVELALTMILLRI